MTTLSTLRILETAHKCIKVGSKEESEVRVLVNSLCNEFTNRMKSDTLFKETYNKTILCGSFRDSLKVLRADEVDFNIVLILPGVVTSGDYPGKVAININSYSGSSECQELLRKFANEDGFLQTSKLRAWSQSMVSKANKNDLEIINGHVVKIKISQNGPAETVYVTIKSPAPGSCLEQGFQLSIDLVLGIYFPPESLQTGSTSHNAKHGWVAIPKPINGSGDYQNILFVPSYPEQESEELKNKCNMKPAIRLVKQMRDRKGVKNLKSYFIKTIFLRINKEKGPEFWNKPLDEILVIVSRQESDI